MTLLYLLQNKKTELDTRNCFIENLFLKSTVKACVGVSFTKIVDDIQKLQLAVRYCNTARVTSRNLASSMFSWRMSKLLVSIFDGKSKIDCFVQDKT